MLFCVINTSDSEFFGNFENDSYTCAKHKNRLMKFLLLRNDLLKAKGLSPLSKIVISYFGAVHYSYGDGFKVYLPTLEKVLGVSRRKLEHAITILIKKSLICVYGTFEERAVTVFMNKKLLNELFPEFIQRKDEPVYNGETEEEILEDMVRNLRKKRGLSNYERVTFQPTKK